MKQLLTLGAIVIALLLVLFGISKFMTGTPNTAETASVPYSTSTEPASDVAGTSSERTATSTMNTDTSASAGGPTSVVLHTNKGDITLSIYTDKAPVTAGNFIKLARDGFYNNTKFHRVIDGFMIQGGDPLTKDDAQAARWGMGGPGYTIKDEFAAGLSNKTGTISMANAGPNTGGSQFFINTADNVFLDNKHAVFGHVTAGMQVVTAISTTKTGAGDRPVEAVIIKSVEVKG